MSDSTLTCADGTSSEDRTFLIEYVLGNTLSLIFGAISFTLCIQYLLSIKKEKSWMLAMVSCLALFELGHVVCVLTDTVISFALNFGNLEVSTSVSGPYGMMYIFIALISGTVLSFYSYRLYCIFDRKIYVAAIAGLFCAFDVGSWIFEGIVLFGQQDDVTYDLYGWRLGLGYIASAATDILITSLMLYAFFKVKSNGSGQGTGRIIRRLVTLTLTTNLLTTMVTISGLIAFLTQSGGDIITDAIVAHFYTFSLMIWLSARKGTQERMLLTSKVASTSTWQGHKSKREASSPVHSRRVVDEVAANSRGILVTMQTSSKIDAPDGVVFVEPQSSNKNVSWGD